MQGIAEWRESYDGGSPGLGPSGDYSLTAIGDKS